MNRYGVVMYGVFAYIVGLIGQVWLILYIGDWDFMTRLIDDAQTVSLGMAIFVDVALILLFALQHSVMARERFKRRITRFIPSVLERSTYVLFSGIALIMIAWLWEPIEGYVWQVQGGFLAGFLTFMYLFGWGFSVVATFVINHFELFGLQQVTFYFIGKEMKAIDFQERFLYKFIRHPIQLGVMMGIWFTPSMSYGHLLFSLLLTAYIFVGLHYEEKDLLEELGDTYEAYQKRVGMMWPF